MDIVLVNPQSDTMPQNSTAPPSLRPGTGLDNSRRPSLPASGQSRGSLAKINSMLIEAPITQVKNPKIEKKIPLVFSPQNFFHSRNIFSISSEYLVVKASSDWGSVHQS